MIVSQVRRNQFAGILGFGTTTVRSMAIALASVATPGTTQPWGFNRAGMLGVGTTTTQWSPIVGPTGFVRLAHGGDHVEGIKADGTLWGWGENPFGEQGDNTTTPNLSPASQASWAPSPVAVGVGVNSVLVASTPTTLLAAGLNASGEIGDNTTTDRHTPVAVSTRNHNWVNIKALSGGSNTSYALEAAGTVWAWGGNGNGQLGNYTTIDEHVPVQVQVRSGGPLTGITEIASGNYHVLAIKSDGTLWSWGQNRRGALGNRTTSDSDFAVKVRGLTNVISAAAGNGWSMAVRSDGSVWAWGDNSHGQLGITPDASAHTVPVKITTGGMSGITQVDGGPGDDQQEGMALKSDGTVYTWGANQYGELGRGTCCADSPTPMLVPGVTGTTQIANASGWVWTIASATAGGPGLLWG